MRNLRSSLIPLMFAIMICVLIFGMFSCVHNAKADDIFHDRSGNVVGKSRVDSNGVTTFSDRAGFTTGKARTDSNGVTRFYDPAGRVTGTARPR